MRSVHGNVIIPTRKDVREKMRGERLVIPSAHHPSKEFNIQNRFLQQRFDTFKLLAPFLLLRGMRKSTCPRGRQRKRETIEITLNGYKKKGNGTGNLRVSTYRAQRVANNPRNRNRRCQLVSLKRNHCSLTPVMLICTLINAEYHCARLCLQKRLFSALPSVRDQQTHSSARSLTRSLVDQHARASCFLSETITARRFSSEVGSMCSRHHRPP